MSDNPDRFEKLRRNKFFIFWCRFFLELNALQAIVQLFYLQRGLTVSNIFYLGIAWSVASLIFDIPSSFLADRWGKKKTMMIGVCVNILANFSLFFCYGFPAFFVNTFFLSFSFSFFSGVEDAFLFDTLREMKQESVVLKTSGKYAIASRASKMLTPLIGVLIASNLSVVRINYLLLINLISSCLAFLFVALLTEPRKTFGIEMSHFQSFKNSFVHIKGSRILKIFTLNKIFMFLTSFIFFKFYQKVLFDLGVSVLLLGLLYPLFNLVLIIVYAKAEYIFKKIDHQIIFDLPIWITLVGGLVFYFSDDRWIAYFLSIFLLITGVLRDPFFNQQIQWRLKSSDRATTSSIMGLFKSVLDIPLLLLSGYIASLDMKSVMFVPILLSFAAFLFFRVRKSDLLFGPQ